MNDYVSFDSAPDLSGTVLRIDGIRHGKSATARTGQTDAYGGVTARHYAGLKETDLRNLRDSIDALLSDPPKPAEPKGFGAVVKDGSGRLWVRVMGAPLPIAWAPRGNVGAGALSWLPYSKVDAVEILSEGVTL